METRFALMPMVVGFADLSSFFKAASGRDALDVAGALQRHYERLGEIVGAHGGRVVKCIGDAVLFCFPEGGARAAVAAAREMAEAAESGVAVELGSDEMRLGVGLAAGKVAVGDLGPPGAQLRDVIGDPVNAAALACHGGGICVTGEVRRALGEDVDAEPAEPIRRAGREIAVYRVG